MKQKAGRILIYPVGGRQAKWRWRLRVGSYNIENGDHAKAHGTMKGAYENANACATHLGVRPIEGVDLAVR